MAATSNTGGYKCEFVDQVPEEYLCYLCHCVARDPHITTCCGEHFCETCITPHQQEQEVEGESFCPSCSKQKQFTSFLNVKYQQKILQLEVYCSLSERGCDWTGPLSALEQHVDSEKGDCEFIDTDCPDCGENVPKNSLKLHLERECFEREYSCPFCNYKGSYRHVSSEHSEECPYVPIQCPNRCGVTCERDTFDSHMLMCPLQTVECEFAFAGCKNEFQRDFEEKHAEEHHKQHYSMLVRECSRMRENLREREEEMDTLREMLRKEQAKRQKQVQELQLKLREVESTLSSVSSDISKSQTNSFFRFPFHFTLTEFKRQRSLTQNIWLADSIKTHPKGYKFQIAVHPSGVGEGAGTHISLSLSPIKSVHDPNLKWPAKCTIVLQLLNQFHDQDHITVTETVTWDINLVNLSRLFIKHEALEWNSKKQTQYLREDTLQFRLLKANVLSQ